MCARKQTTIDRSFCTTGCLVFSVIFIGCATLAAEAADADIATKRPEIVAQLKKAIQDWEATVSNPKQYGLLSR
ncbi:MAG TPA: hypothetical protein QF564_30435 [Pirellulaceae bacterium]|jgi:hypothetical protein|nr:hypothetical protein [Pirellulaceae bacterium]